MRRFVLAALVMVLGMSGVMALMRLWGERASPAPLLRLLLPDASCPPPCWYGINTDEYDHQTTVAKFMTLPNVTQNDIVTWTFSLREGQPQRLRLERGRDIVLRVTGLRLGDWLVQMGVGDYQVRGAAFDRTTGTSGDYVSIHYAEPRVIVTVVLPRDRRARLSPLTPITQIAYPAGPFPEPDSRHSWIGYVQMQAYPHGFGMTLILE